MCDQSTYLSYQDSKVACCAEVIQVYRNLGLQCAYKTVLLSIYVQSDNRVKISSSYHVTTIEGTIICSSPLHELLLSAEMQIMCRNQNFYMTQRCCVLSWHYDNVQGLACSQNTLILLTNILNSLLDISM